MLKPSKRELFEFTIQYFKPSGKYYSEVKFTCFAARIVSDTPGVCFENYTVYMDDVIQEIKKLQSLGESPGLAKWHGDFYCLVTHPNGYPVLLTIDS